MSKRVEVTPRMYALPGWPEGLLRGALVHTPESPRLLTRAPMTRTPTAGEARPVTDEVTSARPPAAVAFAPWDSGT